MGTGPFPALRAIVEFLGAITLLAAIALVVVTEPRLSAAIGVVFLLVNLAQAWAGTSTKWKTEPAQERAANVWSEQIELMATRSRDTATSSAPNRDVPGSTSP